MNRTKILFLAAVVALSTTGCGKNGMLAFAAGLELVAATATLASTVASVEEEQRAREEFARIEARREAERQRAIQAAAARSAPPVIVVVEPAACAPQ
ncbi:MAG: hypothetical protein QM820_65620 [Minicystis sp.]